VRPVWQKGYFHAAAAADGGRGLLLVDTLSARWNWYFPPDMDGKVVWAEVSAPATA
jgi:hypothetical protein